ncbi:MAG: protein-L-isoaspartate(D-aspartate) O-methyltransferase [Chlorobium sp.]|jgi:protein-L-isoaspartate(D-aspartate) O-methyltransferase|nr:MAG: protein-L-isoaspartate(D-aspartate) O-methyltransferase [Chlorobium sp.]
MERSEKLLELSRVEMVETLRQYGIDNRKVLDAFLQVKRHLFFEGDTIDFAYNDCAYPIGFGQTISQPYTVAYMTTLLLERVPSGKVLEIGTGSGYQAAILDALGYSVYTIERIPELKERAEDIFLRLGLDIACSLRDGTLGWPEEAPFDGIIVTAGAPKEPGPLLGQLAENGCMVIPLGSHDSQQMTVIRRHGGAYSREAFHHFVFVPLVGKEGWDSTVF